MARSRRALVYATSVDYARLTGGWVYNSRLVRELIHLGWCITQIDLPAGFPQPDEAARSEASQQFAAIRDGSTIILDQICLSPLADVAVREAHRLHWVMIFHHPMALETGVDEAESRRRRQSEMAALSSCSLVIATSQPTADRLIRDYEVPPQRIVVAEPGMHRVRHSGSVLKPVNGVVLLLALGAAVPRKGYELMIAAMSRLADLRWQLTIVGDTQRAPDYVAALQAQIAAAGLQDRIQLVGGLNTVELDSVWRRTHVFLASSQHEGYGMAVAEALARGLPTVTTDAGTIAQWVEPDAAVILRDRSAETFAEALRPILMDEGLRCIMSDKALELARRLPTWPATALRVHERLTAEVAPLP